MKVITVNRNQQARHTTVPKMNEMHSILGKDEKNKANARKSVVVDKKE